MSHESDPLLVNREDDDCLLSVNRENENNLLPLDDQESIEFHLRGERLWIFRRKRFIITASIITVVANLMLYISLPSFIGKKEDYL